MTREYQAIFETALQWMQPKPNTAFIRIEAPSAKTKYLGVPIFKKSKDQYITSATLEYNLDCEPISPVYKHSKPFLSSLSFTADIYSMW